MTRLLPLVLVAFLIGINVSAHADTPEAADPLRLYLQHALTAAPGQTPVLQRMHGLQMARAISMFYARRVYRPAWSDDYLLSPQVDVLVAMLQDATREGLTPADYHLTEIVDRVTTVRAASTQQQAPSIEEFGNLDLLLTDAFLLYGSHLLNGRRSPKVENGVWGLKPDTVDLATTMQTALEHGDLVSAVRDLSPTHPSYTRLRQTLARYREIAASGGWPSVPAGPMLRLGSQDWRIPALQTRLRTEGYLSHNAVNSDTQFDELLDQALRAFQQQRGLEDDGVVGPATRATLNIPIDTRIQQLTLNMERWRWLPRDLGSPAVIVNTAGFTLEVLEAQKPVLAMKIIIGKPYTRTPLFHTKITAVELNPAWHIPHSIATKELLPLIRRDPQYLTRHHISVVRGWRDASSIDPANLNWARLSPRYFPYHLRQEPGPWNALGRIKFHLPSPFSIYLHDTPTQSLFTRAVRAFSHGCIRIEKPLDFATYLLRDTRWTREALAEAITRDMRTTIRLTRPVPVYIGYWTAWVEENGALHFRPDLYGRDRRLATTFQVAASDSHSASFGCSRSL